MINVITGYEIASSVAKSELLKKEVEEFYLNKMSEIASNCLSNTKVKKKKTKSGFEERLKYQQKILKDYLSWFDKTNTWTAITKLCDFKIDRSIFPQIMSGINTINDEDKWKSVENAISILRKNYLKDLKNGCK